MGAVGFWNKFFSALKFHLLNSETVALRRRMALEESRSYFWFAGNWLMNRVLANRLVRKIVRRLDYWFIGDEFFSELFDKYSPNLLFCAHLFDDKEIQLLREARRRNIKTVGFINSWDKMTARGIIRLLPDQLIVFNELVKKEAMKYGDMPEKRIIITGIPQYDWHTNYHPMLRAEFFQKKSLNPAKKLIVYAPMGKAFSNSDWDIIDLLNDAVIGGVIKNAQLFVRFQPNDFLDDAEIKKRPWLIYDWPGVRFSKKRGIDWDMGFDDIRGLTNTLANADIFICYASSMSIDAAVFNKPVINIDFEVNSKELMSKSPTYFYQMTHYQKALKTGGIQHPKNVAELFNGINAYLENPTLDEAGRRRLVDEQCWKLDGKSGDRISKIILKNLNEN